MAETVNIIWDNVVYDTETKTINNLNIDGVVYNNISPKILMNNEIWDGKEHTVTLSTGGTATITIDKPSTLQDKWSLLIKNNANGINAVDIDWNGAELTFGDDEETIELHTTTQLINLLNDICGERNKWEKYTPPTSTTT